MSSASFSDFFSKISAVGRAPEPEPAVASPVVSRTAANGTGNADGNGGDGGVGEGHGWVLNGAHCTFDAEEKGPHGQPQCETLAKLPEDAHPLGPVGLGRLVAADDELTVYVIKSCLRVLKKGDSRRAPLIKLDPSDGAPVDITMSGSGGSLACVTASGLVHAWRISALPSSTWPASGGSADQSLTVEALLHVAGAPAQRATWHPWGADCLALVCKTEVVLCSLPDLRGEGGDGTGGGGSGSRGAAEVVATPDRLGDLGAVCRGHQGQVTDASFSAGGGALATSSHDGSVRVWDTRFVRSGRFDGDVACLHVLWPNGPVGGPVSSSLLGFHTDDDDDLSVGGGGSVGGSVGGTVASGDHRSLDLLTGSDANSRLRLWRVSSASGGAKDTWTSSLQQTVDLPRKAGGSTLLQLSCDGRFVFAADTGARSVCVLHVRRRVTGGVRFDFIKAYGLVSPIHSFVATSVEAETPYGYLPDPDQNGAESGPPRQMQLLCMLDKPVVLFRVPTEEVYPGEMAVSLRGYADDGKSANIADTPAAPAAAATAAAAAAVSSPVAAPPELSTPLQPRLTSPRQLLTPRDLLAMVQQPSGSGGSPVISRSHSPPMSAPGGSPPPPGLGWATSSPAAAATSRSLPSSPPPPAQQPQQEATWEDMVDRLAGAGVGRQASPPPPPPAATTAATSSAAAPPAATSAAAAVSAPAAAAAVAAAEKVLEPPAPAPAAAAPAPAAAAPAQPPPPPPVAVLRPEQPPQRPQQPLGPTSVILPPGLGTNRNAPLSLQALLSGGGATILGATPAAAPAVASSAAASRPKRTRSPGKAAAGEASSAAAATPARAAAPAAPEKTPQVSLLRRPTSIAAASPTAAAASEASAAAAAAAKAEAAAAAAAEAEATAAAAAEAQAEKEERRARRERRAAAAAAAAAGAAAAAAAPAPAAAAGTAGHARAASGMSEELRALSSQLLAGVQGLTADVAAMAAANEASQEKGEKEREEAARNALAAARAAMQEEAQHFTKKIGPAAAHAVDKAVVRALKDQLPRLLSETAAPAMEAAGRQQAQDLQPALASAAAAAAQQAVRSAVKECVAETIMPALGVGVAHALDQLGRHVDAGLAHVAAAAASAAAAAGEAAGRDAVAAAQKAANGAAEMKAEVAMLANAVNALATQVASIARSMEEMTKAQAAATAAAAAAAARAAAAQQPPPGSQGRGSPAALASPAPPQQRPAPINPEEELRQLLAAGRVGEAVDKALAMSSVARVVWLCRQLDPMTVPRHLTQGTLLCLLSQLSTDLQVDAPVKLTWLQNCAVALQPRDQSIKPFVPSVMRQVSLAIEEAAPRISNEGPHAASAVTVLRHVVSSIAMSLPS